MLLSMGIVCCNPWVICLDIQALWVLLSKGFVCFYPGVMCVVSKGIVV